MLKSSNFLILSLAIFFLFIISIYLYRSSKISPYPWGENLPVENPNEITIVLNAIEEDNKKIKIEISSLIIPKYSESNMAIEFLSIGYSDDILTLFEKEKTTQEIKVTDLYDISEGGLSGGGGGSFWGIDEEVMLKTISQKSKPQVFDSYDIIQLDPQNKNKLFFTLEQKNEKQFFYPFNIYKSTISLTITTKNGNRIAPKIIVAMYPQSDSKIRYNNNSQKITTIDFILYNSLLLKASSVISILLILVTIICIIFIDDFNNYISLSVTVLLGIWSLKSIFQPTEIISPILINQVFIVLLCLLLFIDFLKIIFAALSRSN